MRKFTVALFTGILCLSVFAQKNLQLLGHLPYSGGVQCSNLTGYTDTAGNEYALVGNTQGLSIVDISNPAAPTQLFLVPGAQGQGAFWREVREYNGFAYVTTEESSGIVVVNLNYLPDSIGYHTISPTGIITSHTIFIDENGIAYVNGTNKDQVFLDLNANPWNPPVIGKFTNNYVHDCFVRNDTMWLSLINDGITKVVDATNKATADAPANTLAQWSTPSDFSHNCWLSDDSKYLFTTDEKPNSFLTCYDVTNLNNITETDRTQVNPGSNTIIHNTYFLNNYCVTSYYTYGITIHDVNRKNNLIEVGNFDTSPNYTGDGFHGAWGVWPYLPSGNIIVSDIETGLWILKPTYKRACYLEGVVRDSICNTTLNNVKIEIVQDTAQDFSNFLGKYSMGTPDSGTYTIRYSKAGYQTREFFNVQLKNGVLTTMDVKLLPIATSNVVVRTIDANTGANVPFVRVLILDAQGNTYQEVATNNNAEYSFCDFIQGSYNFYGGRWGKVTAQVSKTIYTTTDTVVIEIENGYYDDFIMDYGWTVTSIATSGDWERDKPEATDYNGDDCNPGVDVAGDYGDLAFVTGNNGGAAGDDDIDNGYTILRSPLFDLSSYSNPKLSFYHWFFNDGGQGSAPNDSLIVTLSNGIDTVVLKKVLAAQSASQWVYNEFRLKDFITLTPNMRIFFKAQDANPGHLVEAGVDLFKVVDSVGINTGIIKTGTETSIKVYPNPFANTLNIQVQQLPAQTAQLTIVNAVGQTVYTGSIQQGTNTVTLPQQVAEGVYTLQVISNGELLQTVRLVKVN